MELAPDDDNLLEELPDTPSNDIDEDDELDEVHQIVTKEFEEEKKTSNEPVKFSIELFRFGGNHLKKSGLSFQLQMLHLRWMKGTILM